ncbi:hypothetical protein DVH24_037871 [Malus domestica]|uniref:Uncharacterized protein n=1 Tax=Malus domestica TaxID=3750 RepID=A0A498K3N4_MALDO|nr:hypothetical protein DVH24_037871 [Malus domestica]
MSKPCSRHDNEDSEEDPLDDGEDEEILKSDGEATNNITMAGKRKQIPHDSSSEASTDNPLIRVVAVIPSSNMVAAIISSVNTQGSANGCLIELGGLKITITLTKLKGKPIGSNFSFLVNDIGFVVRTHAPLNIKQWRNVEKKDVDKMIERIIVSNIFFSHFCYIQYIYHKLNSMQSKYDIDLSLTHVSTYINNALQRRFVDVRHKLKKHFDSIPTLEEVKQNKHEDVTSQEELNFLCDCYASVQLKERSNKDAINRSHLTYNHKGGSKSFRAHEEEIEAKTEEQLSAIDYFEAVLKNTKNDWDKGAKLKWEDMLSMKNKTTLPDGIVMLTNNEIVLGVLGHKSGYFKGPLKSVSREDTMLTNI